LLQSRIKTGSADLNDYKGSGYDQRPYCTLQQTFHMMNLR
jgi:hypothetical protein